MKGQSGSDTPSVDQLRDWFRLDAKTGRLYWRQSHGGYRQAGQEAMKSQRPHGARFGRLPGYAGPVGAAVVVWALDRGRWPEGPVGHRNGDVTDNRPANLVGPGEGTARRRVRSDSVTGVAGVTAKGAKFAARAQIGGRVKHLGMFETVAEAARAVERAKAGQNVQRPAK